jgi:hypothetical protein
MKSKKRGWLKKDNFNAGSPFSCWLKEELSGEIGNYLSGLENRGLVKKYKIDVDDETEEIIMKIKKLDDLPNDLKKVAVDIIRMELDEDFER